MTSNQELMGDVLGDDLSGLTRRLDAIKAAAREAVRLDKGAAFGALADTERALKRLVKRRRENPVEYQGVEMPQTRGPTVEFTGRMLCEEQWEARRGDLTMQIEVWETQGGSYVAASFSTPKEVAKGFEDARVAVIEPGPDEQARRFAVMDHFGWENRARSMLRKLGWDFRLEVE